MEINSSIINVLLMFGLTGLGRYWCWGWRRTFCVSVCVFAVHAFLVMKHNGLDPLELPLHWGGGRVGAGRADGHAVLVHEAPPGEGLMIVRSRRLPLTGSVTAAVLIAGSRNCLSGSEDSIISPQ